MSEDPTRVEARLLGALREISPEMRRDWAEADRKLRRRNVTAAVLGASIVMLAVLLGILL